MAQSAIRHFNLRKTALRSIVPSRADRQTALRRPGLHLKTPWQPGAFPSHRPRSAQRGLYGGHAPHKPVVRYVQWHMAEAWKSLTFTDEAPSDEARERDPVAPARRSAAALAKVHNRRLTDGSPAMSFAQLLAHMATVVCNTCRHKSEKSGTAIFKLTTLPNAKQQQALDLLATITV